MPHGISSRTHLFLLGCQEHGSVYSYFSEFRHWLIDKPLTFAVISGLQVGAPLRPPSFALTARCL
jgi:hypothetical protein